MNMMNRGPAGSVTAINNHRAQAARIAEHGGKIPAKYTAACNRWDEWSELRTADPHAALVDAYTAGATIADLTDLRTAAMVAEALTPPQAAAVANAPAPAAYAALVAAYAPVAEANYLAIAKEFTDTATEFHRLADKINANADAAQMIRANDEDRAAWLQVEILAHQLDTLQSILADAASLAGKNTNSNGALIGLTVDADGLHVRRVWEAWATTEGRTGKWGALATLGATIGAADLDRITVFREPLEYEIRQEHSGIGVRQYRHDPEDDLVTA